MEIIPLLAHELKKINSDIDFIFILTIDKNINEWSNISRNIHKLRVFENVKSLGPLSLEKLSDEYAKSSFVFLPTLLEASTAVYPESFYYRRPLIT